MDLTEITDKTEVTDKTDKTEVTDKTDKTEITDRLRRLLWIRRNLRYNIMMMGRRVC